MKRSRVMIVKCGHNSVMAFCRTQKKSVNVYVCVWRNGERDFMLMFSPGCGNWRCGVISLVRLIT